MYQCPKCNGNLVIVITEEDRLDKCVQCCGLWFDHKELINMLEKRVVPKVDGAYQKNYETLNQEVGSCPLCRGTALKTMKVDQISFEICPNCSGIWLDQGEYTTLFETDDILKKLKNILGEVL